MVTMRLRVPGVAELAVGAAKAFDFERSGVCEAGFVLRLAERWVAFVNRCPHWNVDLDLGDGRFYDAALDRIYCTNHGALFHPETGHCEAGPCVGAYLERLDVELDGADALVTVRVLAVVPG